MNTSPITHTYKIDASDKSLGRLASETAKMLMGKTHASYTPHMRSHVRVEITNASKLLMKERKTIQKKYTRYSGYPGGFKIESHAQLTARKGNREAIRRAVLGMLPHNTMRVSRIKNLIITE